jgi:hypothetical protein
MTYIDRGDRWQPASLTAAGEDALDDAEHDLLTSAHRLTLAECRKLLNESEHDSRCLDLLEREPVPGDDLPSWATVILGYFRDAVADYFRDDYLDECSQCMASGEDYPDADEYLTDYLEGRRRT